MGVNQQAGLSDVGDIILRVQMDGLFVGSDGLIKFTGGKIGISIGNIEHGGSGGGGSRAKFLGQGGSFDVNITHIDAHQKHQDKGHQCQQNKQE